MPFHQEWGEAKYSYERIAEGEWIDFKSGVVVGVRIGEKKRLGIFSEGSYNRYWDREWYEYKTGINIILR